MNDNSDLLPDLKRIFQEKGLLPEDHKSTSETDMTIYCDVIGTLAIYKNDEVKLSANRPLENFLIWAMQKGYSVQIISSYPAEAKKVLQEIEANILLPINNIMNKANMFPPNARLNPALIIDDDTRVHYSKGYESVTINPKGLAFKTLMEERGYTPRQSQ